MNAIALLAQAAEPMLQPWQWLCLAGLAMGAALAGAIGRWLLRVVGGFIVNRVRTNWDDQVALILPGPGGAFLALLLFHLGLGYLDLPGESRANVDLVVRALLIISVTWFALRVLTVTARILEALLARQVTDANRLRSLHTQVAVPRAILRFLIIVLGVGLVLMQFEVVRSVGISLMASAGIAGIVVGLAAQRTIANILAGIQIAFFQPMRIGDTVIIEGEFGWIEEFTLTYVVVKIWDQRRLIVPVSHFLEKPFQNWSKVGSELLGTIFVYTDYTVAVDAIRAEVTRILADTPLWDQRAQGVQVTNLTDRGVEVRVMVSAKDSGSLWDLRCLVREKLLAWLQSQGKASLPLQRIELQETSRKE